MILREDHLQLELMESEKCVSQSLEATRKNTLHISSMMAVY